MPFSVIKDIDFFLIDNKQNAVQATNHRRELTKKESVFAGTAKLCCVVIRLYIKNNYMSTVFLKNLTNCLSNKPHHQHKHCDKQHKVQTFKHLFIFYFGYFLIRSTPYIPSYTYHNHILQRLYYVWILSYIIRS